MAAAIAALERAATEISLSVWLLAESRLSPAPREVSAQVSTSGFRAAGYAVVGTALSMPHSDEPDLLAVDGDITEPETAQRVVGLARDRFGRIDSLINNAGVFIGKPFSDYTPEDYAAITAVNLAGFFHITQLVIEQMVAQRSGHVVNISTSLVDQRGQQAAGRAASPDERRTRRGQPFAGDRIRLTGRARERRLAWRHQDTRARRRVLRGARGPPPARAGRRESATSSKGSCISNAPHS